MFFPVSNMQISQIISEINKTLHSVVRAEPVKPKNEAENSDRSALETVNNDSDKKYEGIPFHKNALKIDYADRGLSVEEYLNVIAYRVPSLCAFSILAIQIQYPRYAKKKRSVWSTVRKAICSQGICASLNNRTSRLSSPARTSRSISRAR